MSVNFNVQNLNNAKNPSFGMQSRPPQNVAPVQNLQNTTQASSLNSVSNYSSFSPSNNVQAQSSKSGFGKILLGALLIGIGAASTAVVFKLKGRTNDKAASKTAETASKASETAAAASKKAETKAEAGTNPDKKKSFFKGIRTKITTFFEDVKKGFSEYDSSKTSSSTNPPASGKHKKKAKGKKQTPPASSSSASSVSSAPASSKTSPTCEAAALKFAEIEGASSAFIKAFLDADDLMKAIVELNGSYIKVFDNSTLEEWAQKTIGDVSSASSSFIKKAGLGHSNVFAKTDADNWVYNEGFSQSLSRSTSKSKRRINVSQDEIRVGINSSKNDKKNVETVEELFKFDKQTDTLDYFKGYKVTPEQTVYSRKITAKKGSSVPENIIEGYKKLSDGTVTIEKMVDNGTNGTYGMYYENVAKYPDGRETYGKLFSFDSSKPELYMEGYVKFPDGSFEAAKEIDIVSGICYEGAKVAPDGSYTAQKKINLDSARKHPVSSYEDYALDSAGVETAKTKIEYDFVTGEPKYLYSDYRYSAADGETYSAMAEFIDGKWIEV